MDSASEDGTVELEKILAKNLGVDSTDDH